MAINDILAEQLASAFVAGQQSGDMSAVNNLLQQSQISAQDVQNRFGLTAEQTGGSGLNFYQPASIPSGLSLLPVTPPPPVGRGTEGTGGADPIDPQIGFPISKFDYPSPIPDYSGVAPTYKETDSQESQRPVNERGFLPYEQRQEFLDSLTPEQRIQWLTNHPNYYPDYNPLMTPYYVGEGGIGYQMPVVDIPKTVFAYPDPVPAYPNPAYPEPRYPESMPAYKENSLPEEKVIKVGENIYKVGNNFVDSLGNFIGRATSGVSGVTTQAAPKYLSPLARMLKSRG